MVCDKSLGDLRGTSIQAVAWCCLAPGHSPNKSRLSFTTSCEVTTHLTRICTLVRTLMTKKWIKSWCRVSGIIVQLIPNLHTTIITRIHTTVQHVNPDRSRASAILTHLPLDKMATISQTMFSDAFSWMKSFVLRLKFLFVRVQLTITQHWFRSWPGAEKATSHYLNQSWSDSLTHICSISGRWVNTSICIPEKFESTERYRRSGIDLKELKQRPACNNICQRIESALI